jgi:hypothetical protein
MILNNIYILAKKNVGKVMLNNYDIFPVATGVFFATSDLHKPPALQPKELHHAG